MKIEFLYFDGCPNAAPGRENLLRALELENISSDINDVLILDDEQARRAGFLGCPSIHINGLDLEILRRTDPPSYSCRIYSIDGKQTGVPTVEMIRSALRRAIQPVKKLLFLCTGNSCRSQMAEGWAKRLIPDVIEAYSAGIETHGMNANAMAVMKESGVDISDHTSKTLAALEDVEFDFVITVCGHAHETCPVFPGKAKVIHRGFEDPPALAKTEKDPEKALDYYRRVRDEIRDYILTITDIIQE